MSERSDEYEVSIDELPDLVSDLELNFDCGIRITEKVPVINIPFDPHPEERKTDNIVAPTRLGLLINDKVKTVFDKLSIRNIQYFKARLLEQNSQTIDESYSIANIVGKFSCVDMDQSKLEFFSDGNIEFIDKLVLDLEVSVDYGHIFRLGEFPAILVISDALKKALETSGVTGLKIYRPEEFSL